MSINEDIKEIKEWIAKQDELLIDKEKGEKKFRFPWGKKVGKSQKAKNFATFLIINENRSYYFKKYRIEDQTILHEKVPRLASAGYVMNDKKGNPLVILPSWSIEPFSPSAHFNQSLTDGTNSKGFALLLARMKADKLDGKKGAPGFLKWVIGLGLVGIIIYAFMTSGG